VKASLEHDGSEVIGIWGMGIDDNFQIAQVQPDEIVEFSISRISAKSADCVFISCTNLRAMEARAELQRKLGIPVLTSNQVAFNAAMDTLLHEA
jgi:maleate isomerase